MFREWDFTPKNVNHWVHFLRKSRFLSQKGGNGFKWYFKMALFGDFIFWGRKIYDKRLSLSCVVIRVCFQGGEGDRGGTSPRHRDDQPELFILQRARRAQSIVWKEVTTQLEGISF